MHSVSFIIASIVIGVCIGKGCNDDHFIRRCEGDNSETTCSLRFVGRNAEIPIHTLDVAFDFDDTSICSNDNNVDTEDIPITQDPNQGPTTNEYNTIQTNLNCFGGFRGFEQQCENDYTVWFPEEGSDNPNEITGARVEASIFPDRPCFIDDGCPEEPVDGDNANVSYTFNARADYICANLTVDGYFEHNDLFLTTCSLSSADAPDRDLSLNYARVEELDNDTFSGTNIVLTLQYGSFLNEDCSFGLPNATEFDIEKDCIAGIVEHHGSFRNDDHILVAEDVNDIYIEFRSGPNFRFANNNRVKVKFLCGKFKDIGYRAYRCSYQGPADDMGDNSTLRYHQFDQDDCTELKDIGKSKSKSNSNSRSSSEYSNAPNLGSRADECLAFLRRYRQCGDDYNYQVLNEGDSLGSITDFGPGVVWQLDETTCEDICGDTDCGDVDIEVDYLCPKKNKKNRS